MNKLVMVIDDSITVCKIIEVCLRREGYEVKSFPDGMQAMRWFQSEEASIPGLIFVDLGLPKMNGYSVIRQFRTEPIFDQTIFVIISRRYGRLDKLKGRLVGAHAHLTKPFKTAELLAIVQSYLGVPE